MEDTQRQIVRLSVEDIIHILENDPVKGDLVPEFVAMKFMNRVSIAHLSIERAFKTLITAAGIRHYVTHSLKRLYLQLKQHAPASAEFLEEAFNAAVQHYRYNLSATNIKHLKSLEMYLEVTGSNRAFQDVRYWELTQSLDEIPRRQIYLTLHIELLHGLREILLAPDRPMDTVASRVERTIKEAMWRTAHLVYSSGTPKERSVKSYRAWLRKFSTWKEALADAVQRGFGFDDDFMTSVTHKAYATLQRDADLAVSYLANTLDILPPQPMEVVPSVEWFGPEEERSGSVRTPAGTPLGFIERGLDGLWYITPLLTGRVSTKAKTQTDARSYLAAIQSRPVKVTVGVEERSLRIVGEEQYPYERNLDEIYRRFEGTGGDTIWTHKVVFWDKDHGIKLNEIIELEVRLTDMTNSVHKLAGRVTEVAEHEVYLSGEELFDLAEKNPV